ncbi:MAG: anti-sigma factor [Xanthobacteraceae bacterium]|nr:anti-sigma factor [Xanthobacteraceae bacterium]
MTDDRLLLNAYVDGELDPAHAVEFEQRLDADPALAAAHARLVALRGAIAARVPREQASPQLRRRVSALARPPRAAPGWRALAASVAAAFVAGSALTYAVRDLGGNAAEPAPAQLLVASHLRSLMASQPFDVASSDRHTVKPWFNGKIPESPRVVDLSSQGFQLAGGRIDVIDLTPVPTLVYKRRLHVISLTALPAKLGAAPPRAIDGYNIVDWTEGNLTYWAVSDLAAPELEEFARAFRAGEPEP